MPAPLEPGTTATTVTLTIYSDRPLPADLHLRIRDMVRVLVEVAGHWDAAVTVKGTTR